MLKYLKSLIKTLLKMLSFAGAVATTLFILRIVGETFGTYLAICTLCVLIMLIAWLEMENDQ